MPTVYHISHHANLDSILKEGGLCCDRVRESRGLPCTGIAYDHIKQRRAKHVVPAGPGGTLADYVPFYFAPRSPMLYTIDRGNVPGYTQGQRPIMHLVTSTESLQELAFVFTDGHADMSYSEYYDDLVRLDQVDWDIMTAQYWNDTADDGDRKRRRQAEFLVREFVPWGHISEIGVINEEVATTVRSILASHQDETPVVVRRAWYY